MIDKDEHFQHFLAYSGFYQQPEFIIEMLKKAYDDGIDFINGKIESESVNGQ
ncbi:hypothetical protein ACUNEV_00610 [Serratia sp. IR-2025]